MNKYQYRIRLKHQPAIYLKNEGDENPEREWTFQYSHYGVLWQILNFMEHRGFTIGRDPKIEKDYKCLTKHHWYGRKGDLEFKAERYPTGFKMEFFQNVITEHRSGGCYDSNTYELAPYLLRLQFINELTKIESFINSLGITKRSDTPEHKLAADFVKQTYVDSWHKPQEDVNFNLAELHGQTCGYTSNGIDRDKKIILNGEIKYYRDYFTGRLMRGRVYHNLNNMWWVILNSTTHTNAASFELFDPTQEDMDIRRWRTPLVPQEYVEKKMALTKSSTRELINELKRRSA